MRVRCPLSFLDSIIYILSNFPLYLKRAFIIFVRFIECSLMGESHYQIHTGTTADFDQVTDLLKVKMLQQEVDVYLRRNMGIQLKRPVIVELYSGNEFNLKGIMMELRGNLGSYYAEKMGKSGIAHIIYVRKGLGKKKFMSILAHEMTHAFLREEKLINTDRFLREGFSRWVEYKILMDKGETEEAEKLRNIRTLRYGKEIEKIIELEGKLGTQGVMKVIRKID